MAKQKLTKAEREHEKKLWETALWWKQLKETNNDAFLPLFFDKSRFLVMKGGGGSGKSIFAGRKVLERVTTEPGHRFLVCRKVEKTLRESCFEQLKGQARKFYPDKIKKIPEGKNSAMYMTFKNGSEIIFCGLDNVEKMKSIFDITGIWIEEPSEIDEGDLHQLDIRLRTDFPYYAQIILTFNPISITHWLKKRFWDMPDERATVHESTYKDNRFLIPEARKTLEAFKERDPYYYMVYCLGQWGVTGKTVFDAGAISERLKELRKPISRGQFAYDYDGLAIRNIRWTEDKDGPIEIWRQPEKGRPYVIGGDTAGEGSDWFVGQVLDNVSGRQVCRLRHRMDEDVYARQIYCLGLYYNTALLGVEANYSTFPVKELARLNYPKQYIREKEDTYKGGVKQSFGFMTTPVTRPLIIAGLIEAMRDNYDLIEDENTLLEMLTFVRNSKNLRPEAEPGAHDDCVMALAIAWYIRHKQEMVTEEEAKTSVWTEDQWEDYYAASEAGRQYLIAKWGSPK